MKTCTNRPEPLESRIAPARIFDVGVPNNPNDVDYNEAPFVNTETAPASDLIAAAVGGGIAGVADTFYLRLSKGDQVNLFRFGGGASTEPFLIVNSGNIIAFFTDKNFDNEVQETEITGISMGKGASFELRAALPGDVVANLDEKGSKDLADDTLIMGAPGSLISEQLNIGGIRVGSSIGGSVDEGILFQTAAETVAGTPGVTEVQTFSISTAAGDVGGTFRLGLGGFTTSSLLFTASTNEVQDALNGLTNIAALGGVTVQNGAIPGEFVVTFNIAGNQGELFKVFADTEVNIRGVEAVPGSPTLQEVQSVDIGVLAGRDGQMVFNFLGFASPGVPIDATALEIEDALNAMTVVSDTGGVTVSGAVGGPFTITFVSNGDQVDVFSVTAAGFAGVTVGGKILSAGNITNVSVAGAVDTIRAGSAADGESFDFFPKYIDAVGRIVNTPGGEGTFSAAPSVGKTGASITSVVVDRLGVLGGSVGSMVAGDGGQGGIGGAIKQIEIRNDSNGFSIFSGVGGDAGPIKKKGGAGGLLTNVYIDGVADDTGNDLITIGAGDGGDGGTGAGGIGGALTNVYVGFRLLNKTPLASDSPLRDNIAIFSGSGGDGKVGGKGAAITNLNILTSTPDIVGDEIVVVAGSGGDGTALPNGRGGVGGAITKSVIRNVDFSFGHDILVLAGDGGESSALSVGAAGGLIQSLTTVGRDISVFAGEGSDGKSGGVGGSLKSIVFDQLSGIFPTSVVLGAGAGGDATSGKAGKGGDVTTIRLPEADLTLFDLNPGSSANGGDSATGRGGAGGIVKDVLTSDVDEGVGEAAVTTNLYAVRAGDGGDGGAGGGAGGSISVIAFDGNQISMDVAAGFGGDALIKGSGGAGGNVTNAALGVEGQVAAIVAGVPVKINANSILTAGLGGDGAGAAGKGGAGGNIVSVNLRTPGDGSVFAGDGGSGTDTGAPGKGGNVSLTGLFAIFGSGELIAGSGGLGGARPAAGGSVTGKSIDSLSSAFGAVNLTLLAGDGTNGGAGGSLKFLGYGSFHEDSGSLVPTPLGDILIAAGNGSGSADGRFAGAGGSIIGVNGAVGTTAGTTTTIVAGDGGSTPKKGGAGGSIENFILQRGGNPVVPGSNVPGVELVVEAGDAGDSPQGNVGAKGGRVNGFTMIEVSTGAVFRHLSAGDGGDALKKGGPGGSVNDVNVIGHDIGLREGAVYGYNSMGGVFSGAGGAGTTPGLGGDVTNVVADAIGSIAAGKSSIPQLANKVTGVYLTGSNLLQIDDLAFQRAFPGGSENDNFPGIPGTTVVYSFGGDTTAALPKDASASVVAEALNALPSVTAAGGVSVTSLLPTGYQINFATPGDRTQITSEEVLGSTANEDLTGELNTPLQITEVLQGSTALNIREIQTVRIDPLLLGRLTASFNGNSTAFQTAASLVGAQGAAVLEGQLNLMPSVVGAGRVHVSALPAPAQPNTFQITFDTPGDKPSFDFFGDTLPLGFAAEVTQGTAAVKEVQRFSLFPTVPAGPNNNPPAITSFFQISFGANKTGLIPYGTAANTVAGALNQLPSIIAAGGVESVTAPSATLESYQVTFRTNGNKAPLHVLNEVTQLPVRSRLGVATTMTIGDANAGVSEVQRVSVPTTGLFSISFGTEATPYMRPGTDPFFVETNLNFLASITNAGGVTVTADPAGAYYEVTFNTANTEPQLTAVAIQQVQTVTEVTPGVAISNVREVQSIAYDPNGRFSVQFPTAISTFETIHGTTAQGEKQILDLAAIQAIPGATFNLSFGGGTTAAALPSNATAAQIENALDTLSTIPPGGVSVVSNGGGLFTITFAQTANQPGLITGTVFGSESTGEISAAGSPDAIRLNLQNALNALPSVTASGSVTVEVGEGNTMNVIFNTFGNKPSFSALNDVLEHQSIALLSDGEYTFTFGDPTDPNNTTPRLPAGSTATEVQDALNALPLIPGGGVTVTGGVNDDFVVTFNQPGPASDIAATQYFPLESTTTQEGTGTLQERQAIAIPERFLFDPVTFSSANLLGGISDATDLNPHIFKWIDADGDGIFESGEQPIDGLVAARSFSQILSGMIPEARFVGGEFTFTETVQGNVATNEVQTLFIKSDNFTLTFGGNETKSLPGKANAAAIASALNALPSIIAAGGVAVSPAAANTFAITFNQPGDRAPVLAPFFYDFNNIIF